MFEKIGFGQRMWNPRSLWQAGAYRREELGHMVNGKYDDPMPIYDKSIDGYPYSDLSPQFRSEIVNRR